MAAADETGENGVSAGIAVGATVLLLVAAVYAGRALQVRLIARWALRQTLTSLELLFPLATRAMPMLLLFVTFLFINTEVWMVASALDGGTLWGAVLLFAAVAVGFLVVRLIEEVDRLDDEVGRDELGDDADVVGLQRTNLVLVLLITQAFQVLLLALAVFAFFIVFGAVAMDGKVLAIWIEDDADLPVGHRPGQPRARAGVGVPRCLQRALLRGLRRHRRDLPSRVLHRRARRAGAGAARCGCGTSARP